MNGAQFLVDYDMGGYASSETRESYSIVTERKDESICSDTTNCDNNNYDMRKCQEFLTTTMSNVSVNFLDEFQFSIAVFDDEFEDFEEVLSQRVEVLLEKAVLLLFEFFKKLSDHVFSLDLLLEFRAVIRILLRILGVELNAVLVLPWISLHLLVLLSDDLLDLRNCQLV